MGFKKVVKNSFTRGWNVKSWVGVKSHTKNIKMIKTLTVHAFSVPKSGEDSTKETFSQCMQRFNLTEADIQKRIKNAGYSALIHLLLSLPMMAYTVYIFLSGFYLSSFLCIMLTLLMLARGLREHFNRFQMQQRRLGCTFQEWFISLIYPKAASRKKV